MTSTVMAEPEWQAISYRRTEKVSWPGNHME